MAKQQITIGLLVSVCLAVDVHAEFIPIAITGNVEARASHTDCFQPGPDDPPVCSMSEVQDLQPLNLAFPLPQPDGTIEASAFSTGSEAFATFRYLVDESQASFRSELGELEALAGATADAFVGFEFQFKLTSAALARITSAEGADLSLKDPACESFPQAFANFTGTRIERKSCPGPIRRGGLASERSKTLGNTLLACPARSPSLP